MSSENPTQLQQDGQDTEQTVSAGSASTSETDEALLAEVEILREENQRLREAYVQAQRSHYRRTALGFGLLGLLATLGAIVFPVVETVLLALGATGLFAAVLTYYLTPERLVSARVGSAVHHSVASTLDTLIEELGLTRTHVYVPLGDDSIQVRLFVPQSDEAALPDESHLRSVFVVSDSATQRGVTLEPVGEGLFSEFERAVTGSVGQSVGELMPQLVDGLAKQFEIVDGIRYEHETGDTRVTVEVEGNAYGPLDRFDHPVVSFLAVGLAHGLAKPIHVETVDTETRTVVFAWHSTQ
ncbi:MULTISPECIES: hypothetical protein [Salinibaculum]|uniref:hypothetical protein n=1 Tax=Salinibaculum TaxID=2732368 RepID=UPI0030CF72EC